MECHSSTTLISSYRLYRKWSIYHLQWPPAHHLQWPRSCPSSAASPWPPSVYVVSSWPSAVSTTIIIIGNVIHEKFHNHDYVYSLIMLITIIIQRKVSKLYLLPSSTVHAYLLNWYNCYRVVVLIALAIYIILFHCIGALNPGGIWLIVKAIAPHTYY